MTRNIYRTVSTPVGEKHPTQQHFKDACTTSRIVERFMETGLMPQNSATPLYGDYTQSRDLQASMDLVRDSERSFGLLDPFIRDAADNSPKIFLEMLATEDGCEKLQAAGLELNLPDKAVLVASDVPSDSTKTEKEKTLSETEPPSQ